MEETKFLGVIFDRRLSFVPHLKYVKKKTLKALSKTDKPAKVQSGRPHKGEDDPIKSYNRFSSLEEMEFDKTPPTSRPVSVFPRWGRRMSPLKHPS